LKRYVKDVSNNHKGTSKEKDIIPNITSSILAENIKENFL